MIKSRLIAPAIYEGQLATLDKRGNPEFAAPITILGFHQLATETITLPTGKELKITDKWYFDGTHTHIKEGDLLGGLVVRKTIVYMDLCVPPGVELVEVLL